MPSRRSESSPDPISPGGWVCSGNGRGETARGVSWSGRTLPGIKRRLRPHGARAAVSAQAAREPKRLAHRYSLRNQMRQRDKFRRIFATATVLDVVRLRSPVEVRQADVELVASATDTIDFRRKPPDILVLQVPSRCLILFMNRQAMEEYHGGSRPNAGGGIGPSVEFTPITAGEWFLIPDSRFDGLFKVTRRYRTVRSGPLQLISCATYPESRCPCPSLARHESPRRGSSRGPTRPPSSASAQPHLRVKSVVHEWHSRPALVAL